VRAFVEKPSPARAEELLAGEALWNTFVFAAAVDDLWELVQQHLPAQSLALERHFRIP
jgi:mannose-1-phosphate guanylyltransferase